MERFKKVKMASILGLVANAILFIIKVLAGALSGSQAMIADAFNSGGDILASLLTYIGNHIASKPRDDDHNLGHGKAEYIFAMLISTIMTFAAFSILKSAVTSLFSSEKFNFSIWLIVVCLITIVVKLALYLFTSGIAKKENNLLMKANSLDHRNDCILTALTLIACLASLKGIYFLDGIIGIVITIWIVASSVKIYIESYDVLMDKSISESTKAKVLEIIESHPEIIKINHFNSTPIGYRYQISFTIFVDGNLSTFESHAIADHLEKEIDEKVEEIYLTVIHVNPYSDSKEKE